MRKKTRGLVLFVLAYIAFFPIEFSVAQDHPVRTIWVDRAAFEYSESVNHPSFFPNKAKFVSKKRMLTKMAPFGLMDTTWISSGLCSFAGIGFARPDRGLAGPVASARTWHCAHC